MTHSRLSRLITHSTAALSLIGAANAGTVANQISGKAPEQTVEAKEESPFDKIWSLFSLYKNDANPFIEEISLSGDSNSLAVSNWPSPTRTTAKAHRNGMSHSSVPPKATFITPPISA